MTTPRSGPRIPRFLLSVPVDADLAWLINDADAALGVRSTHGALVAMIETGGVSRGSGNRVAHYTDGQHDVEVEETAAERRMLARGHRNAADRARRLRARFQMLSRRHQDVLCEAYGARAIPREAEPVLGSLAGVALLTAEVDGRGAYLLSLCRKPGQNAEALEGIRRDAAAMVGEALAAWRGTAS